MGSRYKQDRFFWLAHSWQDGLVLHRYPTYCRRIIFSMKYNLVLQRYQTWSLKSLPFSPNSTTILVQAWWCHTVMPHLFPWPTSSGKAPWLEFALYLWRLGREPSRIPLAFTSIWARLAFLPAMGAPNQGHYSRDEGNFNQRTSARGNGGMCDVTLPPCGELPWRWMKKDGWLARCRPTCATKTCPSCMLMCPCCDWMDHYALLLFLLQVVKHGRCMWGLEVLYVGNINSLL